MTLGKNCFGVVIVKAPGGRSALRVYVSGHLLAGHRLMLWTQGCAGPWRLLKGVSCLYFILFCSVLLYITLLVT